MTRDLSSSIIEKFNGYETIKRELARIEKIEFTPISLVYEPVYDENVPVPCYFTDQIYLTYRSYIGRIVKGEEKMGHPTVRRGLCCQNMKKKKKTFKFAQQRKALSTVFDPKVFVVSYRQICSFHSSLNLEKKLIFRSFQQSAEEIYDLSHFKQENVAFFDMTTFHHLKDAASAVLARQKSTTLLN